MSEKPNNLPPYPPVPEGYDRWEYRGLGWGNERKPTVFAYVNKDDIRYGWGVEDSGEVCPVGNGQCSNLHYIEAVKGPMTEGAKTGTPLWIPMREKLDGLLRDETSNTYVCGRVWHAWSVGTMSEDDFTKFDSGDRIEQMVYEIEAICEERIKEEKASLASDLTEALKVAGEALGDIANGDKKPTRPGGAVMRHIHREEMMIIAQVALAALERIRNNNQTSL
jgi:hypothetical protein